MTLAWRFGAAVEVTTHYCSAVSPDAGPFPPFSLQDAWVTLAWRSGAAAKINITSGEHAKHVVNQLTSTASCGEGEKAVACSCDTAQSSSAGVGFVAPKKTSYQGQDGGAFLGRANYITLVENALSGPANKAYKDACTCTGLYVATVRGKSSYQYKEVAEEEEVRSNLLSFYAFEFLLYICALAE